MAMLDGVASIRDLELEHQRTFIRVDFNCPLTEGDAPEVADDTRIREALPTIRLALEKGAKVVLASHLGRPQPGTDAAKLSLEPVGARLSELLGVDVYFPQDDCVGDAARKVVRELRDGQVALLENLRFHPEEERNDDGFARQLAELAEVYVDDAFATAHRAHASIHALPRLMRVRGTGLLLEKEILALSKLHDAPEKPYVAVLGGAKVSDKLGVIGALLDRVDALLVGGAMANTFLAAQGVEIGTSTIEDDKLALARTLMDRARSGRGGRSVELLLPVDVMVAGSPDADEGSIYDVQRIPRGSMVLDVGPRTVELFAKRLAGARSIFWNGPLGLFEKPLFAAGTLGLARAIAQVDAFTVVGGGHSAAAVRAAGEEVAAKFKHVSTGGGASLELLEGKKLPGVEALRGARS